MINTTIQYSTNKEGLRVINVEQKRYNQPCLQTSINNYSLYKVYKKKCPEYKIASKLDICKIADTNSNQWLIERYTGPVLRVRVSPFYFSIFADVSKFTRNFYPFSRGKQSSTRTTQTGKSNASFLTHTEALRLFIKLEN